MRKIMTVAIGLLLVMAMFALVGCNDEATDTDMDDSDTATVEQDGSTTPDGDMADEVDIPDPVAGSYVDLTPEQAKELIDTMPDVVVIDVSPVYDEGHLPGAVHYYGGDGSLDAAIPTLDETATYLVYCHADGPSIAGAEALVDAGFEMVYRLEGNYAAWVAAGYPVEM